MLNLNDLWIGDRLIIRSTQKTGSYEGEVPGGLAKVKVDGKIEFVAAQDLELIPENEFEDINDLPPQVEREMKSLTTITSTIDLHIEVLNPALAHRSPEEILAHQKFRCTQFVQRAIDNHLRTIDIIHGKGEGVLRLFVIGLVEEQPEFIRYEVRSDGGALEVFFSYK